MRHLLISYHTCPLDEPGHDLAGGMNILLRGFLRHTRLATDVVTRSFGDYERIELSPTVTVHRLPCGARRPWTREEAYAALKPFGESLNSWLARQPRFDVASAHYWMSASLLPELGIPAGILFHTLQVQKGSAFDELEQIRRAWESRLIREFPTGYLHWHDLHNARKHYPDLRGRVLRPGTEIPDPLRRPAPGPPWLVGWAARNDPIKNLDEAIHWVEGCPQHQLLVAGMSAEDLPLVHFLGPLKHARMGEFYARIHQLLNLSDYETFGLSVLEALAAGVSVGVRDSSDWARRLRRLRLPYCPGCLYTKTEQAVARRLALSYSWKRALPRWERWLVGLARNCSRSGEGGSAEPRHLR